MEGAGLAEICTAAAARADGATIFAYQVDDPQRYGVVTFDRGDDAVLTLEEKPAAPKSNWAVTGLYFFDGRACDIAAEVRPSARGELEIVDVIRAYHDAGTLNVARLGRGYAWLDTGTHESLHQASAFVYTMEQRQGLKIMCLEEIGLDLGYLSCAQVSRRADALGATAYAAYLRRRVAEHRDD